ncbi:MAG: YbaN family protein [Candidatus Poseidoniaceae archaeon]
MGDQSDETNHLAITFEGLSDEDILEAILDMHKPSKNPVVRWLWTGLGSIFVVFAAIGTVVPGWPTTSWLVAAGFCFGRSSRRMFRWLLTNRIFGNALLEYYKAGRALPLHSKIVIIGIISLVSAFSIYVVTKLGDPGFGQATIAIVALVGIWFVGWKVPTVQLQIQPN